MLTTSPSLPFRHLILNCFHTNQDDRTIGSEEAVYIESLKKDLEGVLTGLSERDAGVLRMRFGLLDGREYTLDEVGAEFKVREGDGDRVCALGDVWGVWRCGLTLGQQQRVGSDEGCVTADGGALTVEVVLCDAFAHADSCLVPLPVSPPLAGDS
jgi:hypothetical protein